MIFNLRGLKGFYTMCVKKQSDKATLLDVKLPCSTDHHIHIRKTSAVCVHFFNRCSSWIELSSKQAFILETKRENVDSRPFVWNNNTQKTTPCWSWGAHVVGSWGGRAAGLRFRGSRASCCMFLFMSLPVWRTGGVLRLLIWSCSPQTENRRKAGRCAL